MSTLGTGRAGGVGDAGKGDVARGAALRWLAHPVSLLAVGILLLNDHVLKDAYGTWWTGKLSDVAGLVFAPALLAVALTALAPRLDRRRAAAISIAAIGVIFTWVKLTALGAATASAAWSAIAGPSVVLRDPTDLLTLPALALAWYTWRRTAARPAPSSATRRKLATAVVLPIALLATVASSQDWLGQAEGVVVADGQLYVYLTYDYSGRTDARWEEVHESGWQMGYSNLDYADPDEPGRPFKAPVFPQETPACTAAQPDVCFRPTPGRLGVDISHDGGKTWAPEWVVTDHQWEKLGDMTFGGEPRESRLVTRQVAVFDTEDGFKVYAANSVDGVAIRDEEGVWRRVGFPGRLEWDHPSGAPLPPDTPPREYYPVSFVVFGSVLLASASFLAMAALRPGRPAAPRRTLRVAMATLSGLIAVLCGAAVAWTAASRATSAQVHFDSFGVIAMWIGLFGAAALVPPTVLTAGWANAESRGRIAVVALVAGLAGGLAGVVPYEGLGLRFAIGAAVAGALTVLAVRLGLVFRAKRDDAGVARPDGFWPPAPPMPAQGGGAE